LGVCVVPGFVEGLCCSRSCDGLCCPWSCGGLCCSRFCDT
jgi:hypothetical protein